MLSRREALWAIAAGLCATRTAFTRGSQDPGPSPVPAAASAPARKLLIVFLSGGPDGVLTLDPKQARDVEPWVENPLAKDNVATSDVPLGALWAPLAKWSNRMAIVHGVQVESANHFAGTWQFLRMRRRAVMSTPGFIDLIARHHASPLGGVTTGSLFNRTYTPSWIALDGGLATPPYPEQGLSKFDDLSEPERTALAETLAAFASDTSLSPTDRDAYRRVANYLDALKTVPTFKPIWDLSKVSPEWQKPTQGLQRTLWAFEHDLAAASVVYFGFNKFDSHWNNLQRQHAGNGAFVDAFGRFLTELQARRNQHGSLADQTTIVVAGELGRFPRINVDKGKDHLPEISMMLMGAGIQTGKNGSVIGQTGRDMMGLPVDFATGRPGGKQHVMLDDIGSTLLRAFGIEPTQYGYPDRPLEALLA